MIFLVRRSQDPSATPFTSLTKTPNSSNNSEKTAIHTRELVAPRRATVAAVSYSRDLPARPAVVARTTAEGGDSLERERQWRRRRRRRRRREART
ncbi:hypothetical protein ALC62_08785 [Cyphomyrmex costatus]|uniref:Uncharacterized protein n=1 Tax=Cyphomyrmex costatus TaxID=456900 RepID=A0A195CIB2_9HYME|nr:hypothetical protein ALC62_08785 [Cyphomyrmex costatus]